MSVAFRREKQSSTSSATIIPFPRSAAARAESADPVPAFDIPMGIGEIGDRVKSMVEAYVLESYVQHVLSRSTGVDNPFDAVYISILQPDPIDAADVRRLESLRHVEDWSDRIAFDDGLED